MESALLVGVYVTLCLRFGFDIIWGQHCCLVSTFADCHNWREDIVVPFVTTYAVPLRMRTYDCTIGKLIVTENICILYFWNIFYEYPVDCMLL